MIINYIQILNIKLKNKEKIKIKTLNGHLKTFLFEYISMNKKKRKIYIFM